jgi:glutathione peroxidase
MILFGNKGSGEYKNLAYDFSFRDLNGSLIKLSEFKNKVIIIVNVASNCGFTNQYEDLQNVWNKYQGNGLVVIGVPSNDFGNQEPGSNNEIKNFCDAKFGVTFPMTEKVLVKGDKAHPFYVWARENFGKRAIPKWNFHKIIVNKKGKISETFSSIIKPTSKKFTETLEELL